MPRKDIDMKLEDIADWTAKHGFEKWKALGTKEKWIPPDTDEE